MSKIYCLRNFYLPLTNIYNGYHHNLNQDSKNFFFLEALTGFEPVSPDYETGILPLYYKAIVAPEGIEPSRLAAPDFEAGVYYLFHHRAILGFPLISLTRSILTEHARTLTITCPGGRSEPHGWESRIKYDPKY